RRTVMRREFRDWRAQPSTRERLALKGGHFWETPPALPIQSPAKASITRCVPHSCLPKATWLVSRFRTRLVGETILVRNSVAQHKCGDAFTGIFGAPLSPSE